MSVNNNWTNVLHFNLLQNSAIPKVEEAANPVKDATNPIEESVEPNAKKKKRGSVTFGDEVKFLGVADPKDHRELELTKAIIGYFRQKHGKPDRESVARLRECVRAASEEFGKTQNVETARTAFIAARNKLINDPGEGSSNIRNADIKQTTDKFVTTLVEILKKPNPL